MILRAARLLFSLRRHFLPLPFLFHIQARVRVFFHPRRRLHRATDWTSRLRFLDFEIGIIFFFFFRLRVLRRLSICIILINLLICVLHRFLLIIFLLSFSILRIIIRNIPLLIILIIIIILSMLRRLCIFLFVFRSFV